MTGVFHGARLARDGRQARRSIIDAQIERALADAPWPADLLRRRRAVRVDDFDLLDEAERDIDESLDLVAIAVRAVSARDQRTSPGMFTPRPAHPPAVAGPSRPLAGRRGVALPVVVGVLPAADAGAADAGRRGPPRADHAGHDAGGHRAARRPVLPRRHAPLAGQLAAAALEAANCTPRPARPGHRDTPEALRQFGIREYARGRAARSRTSPRCGATAPARCCANSSTPAQSSCSAGRWPIRSSRCCNPRLREFALREGLADAAAALRAHPVGHLGAGVRLRPRHGARLRRRGRRPLHGRRPLAARRHRAGPAGRRHRRRRVRPRPAGQLPGVVAEVRLSRATPPTATSTPTTT